jgi:hypothetical protein
LAPTVGSKTRSRNRTPAESPENTAPGAVFHETTDLGNGRDLFLRGQQLPRRARERNSGREDKDWLYCNPGSLPVARVSPIDTRLFGFRSLRLEGLCKSRVRREPHAEPF